MSKWIKKIFHRCEMKTVDIPHSNRKGEMWIQECVCGKQQEVMFNREGNWVSFGIAPTSQMILKNSVRDNL